MDNTHLCYVYIYEYKCLKDIELVIDCHYNYKYDKEKKTLKITENKDFPDKFWGENIYSITGLVGNNGAGKSTIMSFLLHFLVDGSACGAVNGIIVYENNRKLFYYGENVTVIYNNTALTNTQTPMGLKNSKWKIPCFYYSGHFSPYLNNNPRNSNLTGCNIASDNILLVEDLQYYYKEDSSRLNLPHKLHLYSYITRNHYRICMMLANKELSKIIKDFAWPNYVIIDINKSGDTAIANAINNKNVLNERNGKKRIELSIPPYKTFPFEKDEASKEHLFSKFIYHNLLNIIHNFLGWQNGFDLIDDWQNYIKPDIPIMQQFKSFINTLSEEKEGLKDILMQMHQILTEIIKITEFRCDKRDNEYLYIDCTNHNESLNELGRIFSIYKHSVIVTNYFDLYYTNTLNLGTSILSSGETELLNLFSRIYKAFVLEPDNYSIHKPFMIMLDEAEIGFHPEWQRKYINLVIEFLDALKSISASIPNFQIIISTHSPILLSDIPKCCTNYLKQGPDNKTINVSKEEIGETFAANVFDLYRMSFFMEDGLVGKFAMKKIEDLNSRIDGGEIEGIINEIKMIGDERIQEYLIDKYQKKHPEDESLNKDIIRYYEEKIKQLKNIKEN